MANTPGHKAELPASLALALLAAIFYAEGGTKAKVPFGYLPLKDWSHPPLVAIGTILGELSLEWGRYAKAKAQGSYEGDFVRWLARVGYNANPKEWDAWEKNVRHYLAKAGIDVVP